MKKEAEIYRRIERVCKGVANHRRVQILVQLNKTPEMSVSELTEILRVDFRTASEHIRKLAHAGLVMKRSDGVSVRHKVTDLGARFLKYIDIITG